MANEIYATNISGCVVIAGAKYDLMSVSITYELNEVPKATLSFPVGELMGNSPEGAAQTSKIETISRAVVKGAFAYVYLSLEGQASPTKTWNVKDKWLIAGYLTAPSISTSAGGAASFTCQLVHWIGELDSITKYSASIHAGTATDLIRACINDTVFRDKINAALDLGTTFKEDIWINGMLPAMEKLTSMNYTATFEGGNTIEFGGGQIAARVIGPMKIKGKRYVPLTTSPLIVVSEMEYAFQDQFRNDLINIGGNTSPLASLIAMLRAFYVDLVITPHYVYPAPMLPGRPITKDSAFAELKAEEILSVTDVDSQPAFYRPVAGVILTNTGRKPDTRDEAGREPALRIVGAYPTTKEKVMESPEGQYLITRAPEWFSCITTTKVEEISRVQTVYDELNGKKPESVSITTPAAGNIVAKSIYQYMRYAGRFMSIRSRFRLDVGPGSTVCVETPGTSSVASTEDPVRGIVQSVTLQLDCSSSTAYTEFRLRDVRSAKEDDALEPMTEHPVIATANDWKGCPLIEDTEK